MKAELLARLVDLEAKATPAPWKLEKRREPWKTRWKGHPVYGDTAHIIIQAELNPFGDPHGREVAMCDAGCENRDDGTPQPDEIDNKYWENTEGQRGAHQGPPQPRPRPPRRRGRRGAGAVCHRRIRGGEDSRRHHLRRSLVDGVGRGRVGWMRRARDVARAAGQRAEAAAHAGGEGGWVMEGKDDMPDCRCCGCVLSWNDTDGNWKCPHCGHIEPDHGDHPDRDGGDDED